MTNEENRKEIVDSRIDLLAIIYAAFEEMVAAADRCDCRWSSIFDCELEIYRSYISV